MTEQNMADKNYEDVTKYQLTGASEAELLDKQNECTFIWSNSAGHPVGVIMNYVFRDGRFWLTASSQRARVPAVRRDPRVSVVVTSKGSGVVSAKSLTYKGQCIVHDDEAIKAWFYPALAAAVRPGDPDAQAAFERHLDSPRRVVLEVVPEGRIGFDSTQMWRDTPDAAMKGRDAPGPPSPP
jgi:general stress protein 26